jgi:16S rRNA (cytosine967-C5)-methyltransferase
VAQIVDAKPGERLLDLCAAPGGKTAQIADRSGAFIVAADLSAARMDTIKATMRLHELESISPVLLDATEQLPFAPRSFDKVLVDAPCSGTGTLRRNPEIRWRLSSADFATLAEHQKQILIRAIDMVEPGGYLIYSTCSVEYDENEQVIEDVLSSDDRFRPLNAIRTWPHREGCDGFFVSKWMC